MDITVLIWVAIIILWSVKTASDQKKRTQRQERQADDTDERVAPPVEMAPRPARHARRPAEQEARRDARVEETASKPARRRGGIARNVRRRSIPPPTRFPPQSQRTTSGRRHPKRSVRHAPRQRTARSESHSICGVPVIYSEILKPKFEE